MWEGDSGGQGAILKVRRPGWNYLPHFDHGPADEGGRRDNNGEVWLSRSPTNEDIGRRVS